MTWGAIRDGFKTRLDTISGLSARDVMPDTLPDRDTATVLPGNPLLTSAAHGGKVEVNTRILVRCNRGKLNDSQDALDTFLWPTGANSIIAAVAGDLTLDGSVDDTRFVSVSAYSGEDDTHAVRAEVNFVSIADA